MSKVRLDLLLVERGFSANRTQAQGLIMSGKIRVNGQVILGSSAEITPDAQIEVTTGPRFVSRGGDKLSGALEAFRINPMGLVCVDVGASTGGFTDCLLQYGAAKVYAIDVGKGILHWKLRNDPRVVVMERTNAREVRSLPEPVNLVVCDASFISLKILLPTIKTWLTPLSNSKLASGEAERSLISLIKPQFEASRKDSARGKGVIRDENVHKQVLFQILRYAVEIGFGVRDLVRSPLLGPKGNVEFFAWLDLNENNVEINRLIEGLFDL